MDLYTSGCSIIPTAVSLPGGGSAPNAATSPSEATAATAGATARQRYSLGYRTPRLRVWLAEGGVKTRSLLPAVPIQAVAVIRCCENRDGSGRTMLFHRGDLYLYTDSKAVALAAELLGQSAQDLAAQAVGQMELFFSAIVWYLERHPERTSILLAGLPAKNDDARPTNDERVTKHE